MKCPSENDLVDLACCALDDETTLDLLAHLDVCVECVIRAARVFAQVEAGLAGHELEHAVIGGATGAAAMYYQAMLSGAAEDFAELERMADSVEASVVSPSLVTQS